MCGSARLGGKEIAMNHDPLADEENIRTRAYLQWDLEGRQDGRAEDYWHKARERIEAEAQSAYPPVASTGHRH